MDTEVLQLEQQLKSAISLLQELKASGIADSIEASTLPKSSQLAKIELLSKVQNDILSKKEQMIKDLQNRIERFDAEYTENISNLIEQVKSEEKEKGSNLRPGIFAQKVHKTRTSLLIKMYQNEDARTVYHIFIAVMLVMIIQEMLSQYLNTGIIIDLSLFTYVFGDMQAVILFWFIMTMLAFLVLPLVQLIKNLKLTAISWIPLYLFYQICLYAIPCAFCIYRKLPIASGFVVTCEMTRMSLKVHSYLREKLLFGRENIDFANYIPESLTRKGVTIESLNIPDIKIRNLSTEVHCFAYFFMAPTLIYRDAYPRLTKRRYSMILANLLNVLGTIFYTFIIFQGSCVPYFQSSWREEYNTKFILTSWFKAMIPGTMLLILMFFGMLHSWFNLWAEILCFGDREFYTDWWNVSNFADYYRKWNIVVHEWLFHYVYQDILRFTRGRASQIQCFFAVFIISALIHELILAISMQFFYPILLVMFGGPGVIYTFFSRKDSSILNVFVWSMFFVGNGLLVVLYSWEYFARKSLNLSERYGWKSFFIPHSWALVE